MTQMAEAAGTVQGGGAKDGAENWPAAFFRAVDTFDMDTMMARFTEDCEVRFGNNPPIFGKPAATEAFTHFWSTIAGLRHEPETVVIQGDTATQQSLVVYTTHDGREVRLPAASHMRRAPDGRLTRLWIYADLAPLFAPAG